MDQQYYLDCFNRGTNLYWRILGSLPGLSLHSGNIEWVMSIPRGGVERIFSIQLSSGGVNDAVDELINMIKDEEAPSGILVTPSAKPDNITQILSEKGFTVDTDTGSCMAMDLDALKNQIESDHSNIKVVRVENKETLKTWVGIVNTALFEGELFSFEQFYELFLLDNTYFYLGLYNGHPTSTCMFITDGEIATVEMVSTLKEYRKKGIGTAVVTTALQELPQIGVKTAILRAEKEAVNVYRRIGFVELCKRVVATYEL